MPINEYKALAIGVGANVVSQAAWEADPALVNGFGTGTAFSNKFNKVWRQGTVPAEAFGEFVNARAGLDALDDGNIAAYVANFEAALKGYLESGVIPIVRKRLTADTTFYVGGTGASDANPGTSLQPFATPQYAASIVNSQYDTAGFSVRYECQGAFNTGVLLHAPQVGAVSAQGTIFNFAPGSSVSVTNGPCFYAEFGAAFQIQGPVVLTSTGTAGVAAGYGAYAVLGGTILIGDQVNFGACSLGHMYGNIAPRGPGYTISGSSPSHLIAASNTAFLGYNPASGPSITVTVLGSPAFSTGFAVAIQGGQIFAPSTTVVYSGAGTTTGPKFFVRTGAQINTAGAGINFFPGNVAGTIDGASFGLYL